MISPTGLLRPLVLISVSAHCFALGRFIKLIIHKVLLLIAPDVLLDPRSKNVFLDQSAVFKCETTGGITSWIINGTLIELLPPEIHRDLSETGINTPIGTRLENLTIPARAEYNGTRVQCVVITEDGLSSVLSENATFYIQGVIVLYSAFV